MKLQSGPSSFHTLSCTKASPAAEPRGRATFSGRKGSITCSGGGRFGGLGLPGGETARRSPLSRSSSAPISSCQLLLSGRALASKVYAFFYSLTNKCGPYWPSNPFAFALARPGLPGKHSRQLPDAWLKWSSKATLFEASWQMLIATTLLIT